MKYYVIAGEASGDLHASNLITEIKNCDLQAEFRFWGGDLMAKAAGVDPVKHYKTYDHMGIVEVVKHLRKILKNIDFCKSDIKSYNPDAVIFVDFPGFNLKISPFVKQLGIKTFYYISPTVWIWHESRVKNIKESIDHMFVELPFIKDFYKNKHDYNVDFVGHPLLDSINQFQEKETVDSFMQKNNLPSDKKIIAVLPGSRESEIRENLKTMQSISQDFVDFEFVIAGMSRFSEEFYKKFITTSNITVVFDQTYELIKKSEAAIVVSGTATLETALLKTPQIIVYQTNPITYHIAKFLVKLNFLGLPNLIMDREIVPELIQQNMNGFQLKENLSKILFDASKRDEIRNDYEELAQKLGNVGAAYRTANHIYTYLTL